MATKITKKNALDGIQSHTWAIVAAVLTGTACLLVEYLVIQPWRETATNSAIAEKISGRWEYVVANSTTRFSHKGDCTVEMTGDSLTFRGVRRWKCPLPELGAAADSAKCEQTNAPWGSTWSELCHDGKIRAEYYIQDGEKIVRGFFTLLYKPEDPDIMIGDFYFLPPAVPHTPADQHGTVEFKRLRGTEQVSPPTENDLESITRTAKTTTTSA
jgi:hypothetical protein